MAKELRYLECMSHKSDSVILLSEWNNTKVVLKADNIRERTWNKAKPMMFSSFMEELVSSNLSLLVAKHILSECDKGADGIFTKLESGYCWHMVDRDEILFMFLLYGSSAIANLYGTCGNMMAVEFASPDPLVRLPVAKEYRSWKLRVRMVIALIEMIEELEDTKYGTLLLCDFQRSNFGFIEVNGQLVAKSIDNDISIFKDDLLHNALRFEKNKTCESDDDCEFLQCKVPCDHERGKCSGQLANNNLEMLCSLFLLSETNFFYTGILWEPPNSIKKELDVLLNQCAHPLKPSNSIPKELAKQLKQLLLHSIKKE